MVDVAIIHIHYNLYADFTSKSIVMDVTFSWDWLKYILNLVCIKTLWIVQNPEKSNDIKEK